MDLLQAHRRAMNEFDTRMGRIGDDQWNRPTPCTEWNVRDLVNHLVSEQRWAPHLLAGDTLDAVGDRYDGDQLGTDPITAWDESARAARRAWNEPGATTGEVNVSFGVIPAEDYGWQMTLDLAVHAWDLARGIGDDETLDPDLVEILHTVFAPQMEALRGSGVFAPPQPVAEDADPQARLLAMLGRVP